MLKSHPTMENVQCSEDGRVFVDGIEKTSFRFRVDNKQHLRHVLVADTFMDRQPDKRLHFIDGDKTNCAVSNLAYGASPETKEKLNAIRPPKKKLSRETVLAVVDALEDIEPQYYIAANLGISKLTVSNISRGREYADITGIDPNKDFPKNSKYISALPSGRYACTMAKPITYFDTLDEAVAHLKHLYRVFYGHVK